MLSTLTDREAKVLRLRFGLEDGTFRARWKKWARNLMLPVREFVRSRQKHSVNCVTPAAARRSRIFWTKGTLNKARLSDLRADFLLEEIRYEHERSF